MLCPKDQTIMIGRVKENTVIYLCAECGEVVEVEFEEPDSENFNWDL